MKLLRERREFSEEKDSNFSIYSNLLLSLPLLSLLPPSPQTSVHPHHPHPEWVEH